MFISLYLYQSPCPSEPLGARKSANVYANAIRTGHSSYPTRAAPFPVRTACAAISWRTWLAHAAEAMGIIAAETIADAETMELDYVMIPRATYCQPQIASFGWTEAQAREQGYDVQVQKFPFAANGMAHGLADTDGFVKLLSDARHGELLDAHLIGPDVTELLPELTLAQQCDLTVHEVARNVHAHSTLGEAVKEAVHGLADHMINM